MLQKRLFQPVAFCASWAQRITSVPGAQVARRETTGVTKRRARRCVCPPLACCCDEHLETSDGRLWTARRSKARAPVVEFADQMQTPVYGCNLSYEHAWNAFLLVTSRQLNLPAVSTDKNDGNIVSGTKTKSTNVRHHRGEAGGNRLLRLFPYADHYCWYQWLTCQGRQSQRSYLHHFCSFSIKYLISKENLTTTAAVSSFSLCSYCEEELVES